MSWGCGGAGTPSNQQEAVEWESYCAPLLDHDDDVGGWWLNVCSLGCSGDALASIQSSRRPRINGQRPTDRLERSTLFRSEMEDVGCFLRWLAMKIVIPSGNKMCVYCLYRIR